MSDVDVLKADLNWIRKSMEKQEANQAEIFSRLRQIEADLESIKATQKPPVNGWALVGVIISVIAGILLILDRIYVNQ